MLTYLCLFNCPQVRVREFYIAMQRCPYIHEMKERLLGAPVEPEQQREAPRVEPIDTQVGTIVKVSSCHSHFHAIAVNILEFLTEHYNLQSCSVNICIL